MKRVISLLVAVFIGATMLKGQQESVPEVKDVRQTVKKGWIIGPLPAIGYTSDQGFQYGVLADLFWFGDGSIYPGYFHKFNVEVSRYTKGSGVYHLFYDSKYLFKKIRTSFDISYLTDKMMDFYGFNGYESYYDQTIPAWSYKINRSLFRVTADFQGKLSKNFGWALGVGYYKYTIGAPQRDANETGLSLYEFLVSQNNIRTQESHGGTILEFKAGIVHDTRDFEADPTKGFYSQAIVTMSPKWGNSNLGYSRISLIHRGYVPLLTKKLTFAYRVGYQDKLSGQIPFYALQNITTLFYSQITSEGLGGINTVRGVLRNRVVGDGVFWSNLELRYRFMDFKLFGQDWYLVANPFFDAGQVVNFYSAQGITSQKDSESSYHLSAGAGIKAIMNRNFVVSVELGKPFDKQDGKNGLNVGLNYIF